MKYFQLNIEETQQNFRKRMLLVAPFLLLTAGIVMIIAARAQTGPTIPIWIPIVIGLPIISFALYRGINKASTNMEENVKQFRLGIDDSFLILEQASLPKVTIKKTNLVSLTENSYGIIVRDDNSSALIPITLQDYIEAKERLAKWGQIEQVSTQRFKLNQAFMFGMALLVPIGIVISFLAQNQLFKIIFSIALILTLITCLIFIQFSNQLDRKTKRSAWLILLPIFAILSGILTSFSS